MNQQTLKFATDLARKLGKHIQDSRDRVEVTVQKDIVDICTNIDEEVEKLAVAEIKRKFPKYNIHSEECGMIDNKSEYTWYLDPIDGTKEFIRGIPLYDTCLSLESKNQTELGVIYSPISKILWASSKDTPATKDDLKINVNTNSNLNKSIIYFYVPNTKLDKQRYQKAWDTFKDIGLEVYRLRGSALNVVDLCYVAEGVADGFISLHADVFQGWEDVSAGLLLVQQAGGKVTNIYGDPIIDRDLSKGVVATNGKIHDQLLKIIQQRYQ